MEGQLLELLEPFLGTWPTSGTMHAGQVYELVMPEHHTSDSGYLSLPTPNTMEHLPARTGEARERQLYRGVSKSRRNSSGNLREDILDLMPTPKALDGVKGNLKTSQQRVDSGRQVDLPNVAIDLLPTTTASDWKGPNHSGSGSASSRGISTTVEQTDWGKFEPAIRRWEQVIDRPAPEPTKPDGKDGNHRLSSKFTEWMMGLPDGWITDIGLSRNDELKACGNGVVPQQAELALTLLGIKELMKEKTNASV
jgi:hypothetical protein